MAFGGSFSLADLTLQRVEAKRQESLSSLSELTLETLQSECTKSVSENFATGVENVNSAIKSTLTLTPEVIFRNRKEIQEELKQLTSGALDSFRKAEEVLKPYLDEIKRRKKETIREQQKSEKKLKNQETALIARRAQQETDEREVKEAKGNLETAQEELKQWEASLKEANSKLETKKSATFWTVVGGVAGVVGGAAVTVATLGTGVPLGASMMAAGAGSLTAGGILGSQQKPIQESIDSAKESIKSHEENVTKREDELKKSESRVRNQEVAIKMTRAIVTQFGSSLKDIEAEFKKFQKVSEKFKRFFNKASITTGKAEVLDDVMTHFCSIMVALPVLRDVAKYLNQSDLLHQAVLSREDQEQMTRNLEIMAEIGDADVSSTLVTMSDMAKALSTVTTAVKWESFVVSLPQLTHEVGKTMVLSNQVDFSFAECGLEFVHLENPESLRLCLHQIAEEVSDMLLTVHRNMDGIKLLTQQVPVLAARAVSLTESGGENPAQAREDLPVVLAALGNIPDKAVPYSEQAEDAVARLVTMVSELTEACVGERSLKEEQTKVAKLNSEAADRKVEEAGRALKMDSEALRSWMRINEGDRRLVKLRKTGKPQGSQVSGESRLAGMAKAMRSMGWGKSEKEEKEKRKRDENLRELLTDLQEKVREASQLWDGFDNLEQVDLDSARNTKVALEDVKKSVVDVQNSIEKLTPQEQEKKKKSRYQQMAQMAERFRNRLPRWKKAAEEQKEQLTEDRNETKGPEREGEERKEVRSEDGKKKEGENIQEIEEKQNERKDREKREERKGQDPEKEERNYKEGNEKKKTMEEDKIKEVDDQEEEKEDVDYGVTEENECKQVEGEGKDGKEKGDKDDEELEDEELEDEELENEELEDEELEDEELEDEEQEDEEDEEANSSADTDSESIEVVDEEEIKEIKETEAKVKSELNVNDVHNKCAELLTKSVEMMTEIKDQVNSPLSWKKYEEKLRGKIKEQCQSFEELSAELGKELSRVEERLEEVKVVKKLEGEEYDEADETWKRYNDEIEKLRQKNESLRVAIRKKAEQDGLLPELERIGVTLLQATRGLNNTKEQWAGLTTFCQAVSNELDESIGEVVKHFKQVLEKESRKIEEGKKISNFILKKSVQDIQRACAKAFAIQALAEEYTQASELYLLPSADQLGRLVLPSSDESERDRLRDLEIQCDAAQNGIERAMKESDMRRRELLNKPEVRQQIESDHFRKSTDSEAPVTPTDSATRAPTSEADIPAPTTRGSRSEAVPIDVGDFV